jgi:RNA recognition motif-containing protein
VKTKAVDDDDEEDEDEEEEEDKQKKPEVKTPGNKSNVSGGGGKKLFVGNLSFRATEDTLYEFFKAAGPVSDVYIAQDDNGSRGFGFVRMDTEEGVAKVMSSGPHPHAKQCLWIIFFQYLSWLQSFGVVLISYLHAAPCRHLS